MPTDLHEPWAISSTEAEPIAKVSELPAFDTARTAATTITASMTIDSQALPVGVVTGGLFGAVATNDQGFHDFVADADYMGVTSIRFPGGTIGEAGTVTDDGRIQIDPERIQFDDLVNSDRRHIAYDITFPELINPRVLTNDDKGNEDDEIGTLSQIFADAIQHDARAGIALPTERYVNGLDLTDPADLRRCYDLIEDDLTVFLDRLKAGAFNNGNYPSSMAFVIGNENYADPVNYALVTAKMMDVINAQLAETDINYLFGVQMGKGSAQWQGLIDSG